MYVTISVGHRMCVAVIPTEQIFADELRDVFTGMALRLKHLVMGRTPKFDLCLMGNKVNSGSGLSETAQAVASVMVSAVRYGEFLKADHVTFHRIKDLMQHVEDSIAYLQTKYDSLSNSTDVDETGMKIELLRELSRLNSLRERAIVGVKQPENFW